MLKNLILSFCLLVVFHGLNAQEKYAPEMARMRHLVRSENSKLNTIAEQIFSQCIFSKLFDPLPPAMPDKWFSPGGGYVGQWIWDTQFVLAAYAPMGEDSIIRGVYRNYWNTIENNPEAPPGSYRYGMIPNFLKDWPPLGYSQIPILAWGMLQVYRQTGDRKLLEQSFPFLEAFDKWYSTERDIDNDGLIEFGAYKPIGKSSMVQTARYETFDYFPPMDSMKLTKHPKHPERGEWYGNVEGVEQTCFLLMSERAMVEIARELGKKEVAGRYEKIIRRRVAAIQKKMWDQEKQFFFSLDRDTDRPINVRSIQGFLTMCCDAATKEQAKSLAAELMDTTRWWCAFPVPTVALTDPKFDSKGFWRGDMWPVTTYLVAYGLNRYGYHREARLLTDKIVDLFNRNGVNERYNAINGNPLGVNGLGMSCSVWSMIVENYYGLTNDYSTICVPPNAKGKHLKLGKIELNYPEENQVELCSDLARSFKIIYPAQKSDGKFSVSCGGLTIRNAALKVKEMSVEFTTLPGKHYLVQWNKSE